MEIKELIKKAHENAKKHGFWDEDMEYNRIGLSDVSLDLYIYHCILCNKLMLIVSELTGTRN